MYKLYLRNIIQAGGLSTTAIVKVLVSDVNDNHPVFYPREYNVSVSENRNGASFASPIVAVAATDEDSGKFGIVSYRIVSGNEGNVFRVDRTTGEIFVTQPKVLSAKARYKLIVSAMDGAGLKSESDAEVHISITDASRSPLLFERPKYKFEMREDAKRNSVVGTVKVAQRSGTHDTVQYYISSGDPNGNFSIDSETGVIHTATGLDHETQESVLLSVQAVSGDPPTYGHTQVNILIQDVNDNPPEFGSDSVRISVPEDVQPGTPLYQAHARDRDSGKNSQIRYRLAAGGKYSGQGGSDLFAIDPLLGHLTLTRHLDYEVGQRHSLVIVATDSGTPSLSSNMSLIVEVQDVNDNPPVFERFEYSVSVPESLPVNSQIQQVTAVDQDTGNNARLTYRIKSSNDSNVFGIFPNSGLIYLKEKLDRETKSHYEILVGVTDNGTPADTATTKVLVTVLDANDNDPKFRKDSYEFHVEENSPVGTFVGKISATDADAGANALIKFSFIPGSLTFRINPSTGDIYATKPLDRETKSSYELVAEARDQGVPPRSFRVPVRIHVADLNDNSPELIDPREDVISVREEQPPGTEVTKIKAIDKDDGNNATITYSILKGRDSDGYGVFTIDPISGSIRTRVVLDHEERSIYRLAVAATDGGNPPRQTVRVLRVEVLDLSDHRPTFTSSTLHFKVKENVKVGFVVGSVAPTDSYSTVSGQHTPLIRYTMTGGSVRAPYNPLNHLDDLDGTMSAFEIDKRVGNLVVCRDLDREIQSEYVLEVRALDTTATNNPQSSAVTIRIEVVDVNDNAPVWPANPLDIILPEDTPVSTVISNYSATDADTSFNSELRYSLVKAYPVSGSKVFTVDALTGIIALNSPLDYEEQNEYILVVSATDQALNLTERHSTAVTFVIKVTDTNDNEPEFVSPKSKAISLSDVTEPGTVIAKAIAIDRDSGENGRVSYAITGGNEDGRFSLGTDTGYLTLSKSFMDNNTLKRNSYLINVTASDHGTPARHKFLPLRILIRGSTDSSPKFLNSTYSVSVPEDIPSGSVVITLEARSTNFESGVKRNLTYHIPRGVADDKFAVDPQSGVITTRSTLDRETKNRYLLPIYVTDQTGKQQYDVTQLTVDVLDVNDHAPEFKRGSCYPIHVPENSDLSVIHKVTATDLDAGANGEITYSITSGNVGNKFSIDLHSGLLSARPLDREAHSKYVLLITAQDRSSYKPLQGSCNVTIIVDDENDNDPRFLHQKYSASIPEDTAVDSVVLIVQATDADVGVNSRIVYSLANESHWLFKIDNKTGVISTSGAGPTLAEKDTSKPRHGTDALSTRSLEPEMS
ncbi:hypothetical protein RUM44_013834 [Polyplax serrata]|uniref:Cadherin domain-containing protein n=1 Tax=Polyplax serrata TaxID=468196 RepID=A0ABR1BIX2_POLSC